MKTTMVLVLATSLTAAPLAAQQPSLDTERTVFDEELPGPPARVTLAAGVAYRVEISPIGPGGIITLPGWSLPDFVSIDYWSVQPQQLPVVVSPLSDRATPHGGIAALIIPRETGDYRIEAVSQAMVRVVIVRDPKETARWAAVPAQTRSITRHIGAEARMVGMSSFASPDGLSDGGFGEELCLGMLPRGSWFGKTGSGCALSIARYARSAGTVVTVGVAPRIGHLVVSAALGGITAGRAQSYYMIGLGYATTDGAPGGKLRVDLEGGVRAVGASTTGPSDRWGVAVYGAAGVALFP